MGFLGNFLNGDNDEVLFFILVFLFVFNSSIFGSSRAEGADRYDNSSILFFAILFLILFFGNDYISDPK